MTTLNCTICRKELENGLDTFGDVGDEMCYECWLRLPEIVGWYNVYDMHTQTVWDDGKLILVMRTTLFDEEAYT